jgi:hypothetical protein
MQNKSDKKWEERRFLSQSLVCVNETRNDLKSATS